MAAQATTDQGAQIQVTYAVMAELQADEAEDLAVDVAVIAAEPARQRRALTLLDKMPLDSVRTRLSR
jgi:hypothetical protein